MEDQATVAARFLLFGDLLLLFGLPCYALLGAPLNNKLRFLVLAGALLGIALSLWLLALLVAGMAGTDLAGLDQDSVRTVLDETPTGKAEYWRLGSLASLMLLGLLPGAGRRAWHAIAALLAGIALGSLAWNGHGAATEGGWGWPHLIADIVHLLAAGLWLGALALLLARLARRRPDPAHVAETQRALARFAWLGSAIVAALLLSGLVNAWVLVGPDGVPMLTQMLYGKLLIAKLGLFALMLLLAARNRFRLTPALADSAAAVPALRLSLALETAAAILIIGLVAWLGTLEPMAGM